MVYHTEYDVIVVGAGHAGNEAAAARFETTARTTTRFGTPTQSARRTPTHRRADAAARKKQ